jgi:ribosome-associated protein
MPRLELARGWSIPEADLELRYVHSSGPGGQNVNKVATKVELRFRLAQCTTLSVAQKRRLSEAFPGHVTRDGDFILTSDRYRSRQRNRQDALSKLARMIRTIRQAPKSRVPTRPTAGSTRRRVDEKRQRGQLKRQRSHREDD